MTQSPISPWTLYKGWESYQDQLVKAIEPLTAEQLELGISPNLRSIGLLITHIVDTRAGWLSEGMGEGGPEVAAIAQWEHDGNVPPPSELVRGLKVTFQAWQECLQRWTLEDMADIVRPEYDGQRYEFTRQWITWHVIEHDMHHGGELGFSLGAHGIAAIDI